MLLAVGLARRRRVHYHDVSSSSARAGEHHHHHYAHAHHAAVAGPALAASVRLEEKLRGAALQPSVVQVGRAVADAAQPPPEPAAAGRRPAPAGPGVQHAQQQLRPSPPGDPAAAATRRRHAELTRTLSRVEVCAVCLEEVPREEERVTRLPCSHKYHSDCVLPWLAVHPDCPCCRALVPSTAHTTTILL